MSSFERLSQIFGRLVALRLRESHLTPSQFAQQRETVNYYTLGRILRGSPVYDPHLSTMCGIADALGNDLHELLGSREAQTAPPFLSDRDIEIVTLVGQLPPVVQRALLVGLREAVRELRAPPPPPS